MAWTPVDSDAIGFDDGNGGHIFDLGAAPQAGDIDVLFVNSDTIASTPSGWTLPTNGAQVANQGAYGFYRIAAGGEGSTVTITTSGNFNAVAGWSRWRGNGTFELATGAQINGTTGAATPSLNTGALATTGELVVVAALLHRLASPEPANPVWSSGYTGLTSVTQGTGTPGTVQFVGYRTDAGTAAETPSATWDNGAFDRYAIALVFAPNQDQSISGSDSAALTDAAALTATASGADSAALTDAAQLAATATGTDTATLSDSSTLTAATTLTDSATLDDTADLVAESEASDTAEFTDTAALTYEPSLTDAATLDDLAELLADIPGVDSATLTETSSIGQAVTDTATLNDAATLAALFAGVDSAAFSESAALTVALTATDLATLSEASFAAESGVDITVSAGSPRRGWSAGAPWI